MIFRTLIAALALTVMTQTTPAQELELGSHRDADGKLVINAKFMKSPVTAHKTRLLQEITDFMPTTVALDQYGGWTERKYAATGFFHTRKIGDRWWIIDPEGHPFLHMAVVSVSPGKSPQVLRAFPTRFGTNDKWRDDTIDMLRGLGFNGTGCWSDDALLQSGPKRCTYTPLINFMSSYGKKKGVTHAEPGHTGFQNRCIPVFDPEFETYANELAQQCAKRKDDPWLLGWFSDNELPFPKNGLDRYLQLDEADHGRRFAEKWLEERGIKPEAITDELRAEFAAIVMDRYLSIVSSAIRRNDPNHMYLGPRFHGEERGATASLKVAGQYLDAIAVNIYGNWDPGYEAARIEKASGKPVIVTEWYAKAMDTGLPNTTGAGWLVATQADRAGFYEHFTMSLLELKACVGWHWFKYLDNDPEDLKAELSNRDANKGMLRTDYEPYAPLVDSMKRINQAAYPLTTYFDSRTQQ